LYAYDPDIGRLAVTTPAYNTAILAVNQGALPYGGLELARLFDGDQRIAANIGGRPPASFGVVVRDRRTRHETTTQRGRLRPDLDRPPLRLVEAPRGAVAHPVAYPRRAYAGAFSQLEAVGSTRGPGLTIQTRHRFRADSVQTWWRVTPEGNRRSPHDVTAMFPSTGSDATVTAVLRDGARVQLSPTASVRLADTAFFHLSGTSCGYVVVPRSQAPRGRARLIAARPQASAPLPGPTLALELITGAPLRPVTLSVRIAPARGAEQASRVATALGARLTASEAAA
jgi:hypothetical protein